MTEFLNCNRCGKCVSTAFTPVPTDTPDLGIIIRAYIECPECIEKRMNGEVTKEEALHLLEVLQREWIPNKHQQVIYPLINKLRKFVNETETNEDEEKK